MAKSAKICRVCGAKYPACNSAKTGSAVFNWREVACSPECGLKYLAAVNAARNKSVAETPAVEQKQERVIMPRKRVKRSDIVEAEVAVTTDVETDDAAGAGDDPTE